MYGAILGDIIGCPYEYSSHKSKEFPLFGETSHFTDDTIMTIAVCKALLMTKPGTKPDKIRERIALSMAETADGHRNGDYGRRFGCWLFSCMIRKKIPEPYNSYGNGSAMRVSSVGWLYNSITKTREMARMSAEVTHNHPEGMKGAEATASAIYLARTGHSKEYIKDYIESEFGYDLSRTCDKIRPTYRFNETCQGTVPEAIICFLEGEDFEDVIRLAVSLGGDADTLAAIAGSIAEGYYDIPKELIEEARSRLPKEFCDVIDAFDKTKQNRLPLQFQSTKEDTERD